MYQRERVIFTDGDNIALYDLKHLEQLLEIAGEFLREADRAEAMIKRGYEKVIRNFTWSHCADWILNAIHTIAEK